MKEFKLREELMKRKVMYNGYTLKIYKLNTGYYGVRLWEGNKKIINGSGNHQYAALEKTRDGAIREAKDVIRNFK